jgi:hypothetical protein
MKREWIELNHNPIDGLAWLTVLEESHLSQPTRSLVQKLAQGLKQNDLPNLWQTYYLLINLRRTFSDPLEQAETTLECGLIIYQLGDMQKAIQLLTEAEQLYGNNKHYQAVLRWMVGCIQWELPEERSHSYESWSECLHLFILLQSCSVNQDQARWYGERIQEIRGLFEMQLNQEQSPAVVSPPAEVDSAPEQPAGGSSAQAASEADDPQAGSIDETDPLLLQLFQVVEKIPAGGFGPVGFRSMSISEVYVDQVIIESKPYRMTNLRGSGKVVNLPANKYVVVKITGDSMNKPGKLEEEGVDLDDYVLLRLQESAYDGDIVAAEIDSEDSYATLKRFRIIQSGLKYILEPQSTNPIYQPREFTHMNEGFHIRGVALLVFKPIKS